MRNKRIGLLIIGVLVIVALGYALRARIVTRIMQAGAKRNMAANLLQSLPDGLHVALCGAGSPMPDPERSGPCIAVVAGRSLFVVDAGTGGPRNLQRMALRPGDIDALFLTHFHSDHIDGLGEMAMLRWVTAANTEPLPVYGPFGVDQVVAGFNQSYQQDGGYRTEHHGPTVAPPEGAGMRAQTFTVPDDGTPATVWDADGVRITAFAVDHRPASPAVGYRFDYGGRSVVISGDTKKTASVAEQSKGVDLLVHEALATHMVNLLNSTAAELGNQIIERITHDILDYHTTPVEAAEIAAASDVGALLYVHIVPPLPFPGMEAAFLQGVSEAYDGPAVVGVDGTFVSLPSGSEEIEFSDLL